MQGHEAYQKGRGTRGSGLPKGEVDRFPDLDLRISPLVCGVSRLYVVLKAHVLLFWRVAHWGLISTLGTVSGTQT